MTAMKLTPKANKYLRQIAKKHPELAREMRRTIAGKPNFTGKAAAPRDTMHAPANVMGMLDPWSSADRKLAEEFAREGGHDAVRHA